MGTAPSRLKQLRGCYFPTQPPPGQGWQRGREGVQRGEYQEQQISLRCLGDAKGLLTVETAAANARTMVPWEGRRGSHFPGVSIFAFSSHTAGPGWLKQEEKGRAIRSVPHKSSVS